MARRRAWRDAHRRTTPSEQPVPQSFTAMPHGKLPTATDLVTLSFVDVDHRDVVRDAVGGVEELLVGREGELPDPLADQQIVLDLVGLGVDHRDPVGRPERDESLASGRS